MMGAEELFCDGKVRLFDVSSDTKKWREEDHSSEACANVEDAPWGGSESYGVTRKPPVDGGEGTRGNGDETGDVGKGFKRRDQVPFRSVTNRKDLFSISTSDISSEDIAPSEETENRENACKSNPPTRRQESVLSAQKPKAMPARVEELSSAKDVYMSHLHGLRVPKRTEEPMLERGRIFKETTEMEAMTSRKTGAPTMRTSSNFEGSLAQHKCEGGRTPVKWKGEAPSRNNQRNDHTLQSKRFSRQPRSASLAVEGFSKLANRSCVSLNNSRCSSPTRSFSLPATTPTSPTASSSSFSVFSSSSSSSKYRGRLKDFFKFKKQSPREADSDASDAYSFKLRFISRSFFPFFKSKEVDSKPSKSSSVLPEQVIERGHRHESMGSNGVQVASSRRNMGSPSPVMGGAAKPPSRRTISMDARSSSTCKPDPVLSSDRATSNYTVSKLRHAHSLPSDKLMRANDWKMCDGIDDSLWIYGSNDTSYAESPTKQTDPNGTRVQRGSKMMVNGAGLSRSKGLERPIPYTSSVRVTPVLNVPSCITPSLRKGKPSSRTSKTFRLVDTLFTRSKGKVPLPLERSPASDG
ncbi:hypothetical protein KP509_32G008300 [Ceratopteris richardii]|nr:hypothetical protein KP509_32G008300 [Ceratopteris richardii]